MPPTPEDSVDSPTTLDRASRALSENKLDLAISEFSQLIEEEPNSSGGYLGRGVAYRRKGQLVESLADYNKAIEVAPCSATYINRGNIHGQMGHHEEALADLNNAIELKDENCPIWPAYKSRADCCFLTSRFEQALADYHEVIRLKADYSDAYHGAAKIWATCPDLKLRDGKLAVRYAAKANELFQEQQRSWSPEYMYTLILAFIENRNFQSAINVANGILKKEGLDEKTKRNFFRLVLKAYRQRADFLGEAGQYSDQVDDLTMVVTLVPSDAAAFMNRSVALGKLGDKVRAESDRQKSLVLSDQYFREVTRTAKTSDDGWPTVLVPLPGCHILFHEKSYRPFVMSIRPLSSLCQESVKDSRDPNAWFELIRTCQHLSHGEKVACLQRAVILDQHNAGWWYTLGCHYELEGKDWHGGVNAFNHTVFLNPQSGVGWFSLSQLWGFRGVISKHRECLARYEALPHY